MAMVLNKKGRPRLYGFLPAQTRDGSAWTLGGAGKDAPAFRSREVGAFAAALNELMERVIDQTEHLPQEAVDFVPGETKLSVGRLMLHLTWADIRMFGMALGKSPDPETEAKCADGALAELSGQPKSVGSARELIDLMRKVRFSWVIPWCAGISDISAAPAEKSPLPTLRDVFMHLCWHWTYHSGHIGLLTMQAGYDYTWTFPG